MMLANSSLRVVPLTIHLPLSDVEKTITTELFKRTIKVLSTALRQYFNCPFPRIAIAGLNPHAGEDGHLGRFETDKLIPLYKSKKLKKHLCWDRFLLTPCFILKNEIAMMSFYACIMTKP